MIGLTLRYKSITWGCSWSRSGTRPPIREAILPRSPPGMVAKRGRRSPSTMSRVGSWKLSGVQSPRSAGKLTAGHGGRSPPIRLDNYVSNGSIYAYIIPGGFPGRILLDWFPKGGCKNTQSIVYYLKKNSHSHACINTPGIRKQTLLFYG